MSMYVIPTESISDILYSTRALSSADNQLAGTVGVGQLNHQIAQGTFNANRSGFLALLRTGASANSGLFLMKGTPPTPATFKSGVTSQQGTAYNSEGILAYRTTDALVKLNLQLSNPALVANNVIVFPSPAVALATGECTWFMLFVTTISSPSHHQPTIPTYYMMGTVSDMAGDGDLKLNTTSIASNQSVDLKRLQIPLPTEFRW